MDKTIIKRTRFAMQMAALAILCVVAGGCSTVKFYSQAFRGQVQVFSKQTRIEDVLRSGDCDTDLRRQLELVLKLREFAEIELGLKADGHFLRYADLGRPYVVWTLYAAPELSLKPKRWWYPVVGRLSYRGFFDERLAEECADRLRKRGFDVYSGGVEAYSTLGWFRDPVLNTFIHRDEAGLADLIFHELAHQRVFIPGNTDFNEAFAVTVAREGVRRWLRAKGDMKSLEEWEHSERCGESFVKLVQRTRSELEATFNRDDLDAVAKREAKDRVITGFRTRVAAFVKDGGCGDYSGWITKPVNNARLNSVATYYDQVPALEKLLWECGGDLMRFYEMAARRGREVNSRRVH